MIQTWSPTTACYDLSSVFTLNGLAPHAAFKPIHSGSNRQPCSMIRNNSRSKNFNTLRYSNSNMGVSSPPLNTSSTSTTATSGITTISSNTALVSNLSTSTQSSESSISSSSVEQGSSYASNASRNSGNSNTNQNSNVNSNSNCNNISNNRFVDKPYYARSHSSNLNQSIIANSSTAIPQLAFSIPYLGSRFASYPVGFELHDFATNSNSSSQNNVNNISNSNHTLNSYSGKKMNSQSESSRTMSYNHDHSEAGGGSGKESSSGQAQGRSSSSVQRNKPQRRKKKDDHDNNSINGNSKLNGPSNRHSNLGNTRNSAYERTVFDLESSAFPPLPGAASVETREPSSISSKQKYSDNSEISVENNFGNTSSVNETSTASSCLADVVKGTVKNRIEKSLSESINMLSINKSSGNNVSSQALNTSLSENQKSKEIKNDKTTSNCDADQYTINDKVLNNTSQESDHVTIPAKSQSSPNDTTPSSFNSNVTSLASKKKSEKIITTNLCSLNKTQVLNSQENNFDNLSESDHSVTTTPSSPIPLTSQERLNDNVVSSSRMSKDRNEKEIFLINGHLETNEDKKEDAKSETKSFTVNYTGKGVNNETSLTASLPSSQSSSYNNNNSNNNHNHNNSKNNNTNRKLTYCEVARLSKSSSQKEKEGKSMKDKEPNTSGPSASASSAASASSTTRASTLVTTATSSTATVPSDSQSNDQSTSIKSKSRRRRSYSHQSSSSRVSHHGVK